jgi:hypothetical protein
MAFTLLTRGSASRSRFTVVSNRLQGVGRRQQAEPLVCKVDEVVAISGVVWRQTRQILCTVKIGRALSTDNRQQQQRCRPAPPRSPPQQLPSQPDRPTSPHAVLIAHRELYHAVQHHQLGSAHAKELHRLRDDERRDPTAYLCDL